MRSGGLLLGILLVSGCRSDSRMTDASRRRLEAVPRDSGVLLSLMGRNRAPGLPDLGPGGRVLSRTERSWLLDIPRSDLRRLSGMKDVDSVTVWGSSRAASRLDPFLRTQILETLETTPSPAIPLIATFELGSRDLEERLRKAGTNPRTVIGGIATLDASPEALFRILEFPDVKNLMKPRVLKPLN